MLGLLALCFNVKNLKKIYAQQTFAEDVERFIYLFFFFLNYRQPLLFEKINTRNKTTFIFYGERKTIQGGEINP